MRSATRFMTVLSTFCQTQPKSLDAAAVTIPIQRLWGAGPAPSAPLIFCRRCRDMGDPRRRVATIMHTGPAIAMLPGKRPLAQRKGSPRGASSADFTVWRHTIREIGLTLEEPASMRQAMVSDWDVLGRRKRVKPPLAMRSIECVPESNP